MMQDAGMGAELLQGQIHSLLEGFRKVIVSRLCVRRKGQTTKAEEPQQDSSHCSIVWDCGAESGAANPPSEDVLNRGGTSSPPPPPPQGNKLDHASLLIHIPYFRASRISDTIKSKNKNKTQLLNAPQDKNMNRNIIYVFHLSLASFLGRSDLFSGTFMVT